MPRSVHHPFASPAFRSALALLALGGVALALFPFAQLSISPPAPATTKPSLTLSPTIDSASSAIPDTPPAAAAQTINALEIAAAQDPSRALALARQLAHSDPASAREIGYALITALHHVRAFDRAAAYAAESPAPIRHDLVIAAFHEWGRYQPDAAWTTSIRLTDPAARDLATQSILSGWARNNPEELAETALLFPEGPEKNAALTKALRAWMIKDPDKAGDWILSHEAAIPIAQKFFASDKR